MVQEHGNGTGATTHRQGFGTQEIVTTGERQQSAIVARVTAEIQARSIVAMQRPRDLMQVRERLLADAARPAFAAVARYKKPLGKQLNDDTGQWEEKYAEGPSIRFVEAAMRAYGNCVSDSMVTEDSQRSRTIRVTVTDLESNVTHAQDVTFAKTLERRKPRDGQVVVSARTTSKGKNIYVVEASDDELLNKQAALVSKAVRTSGLRVVPGDIVEEAMNRCQETIAREDKRDPAGALKSVVDAFAKIGIRAEHLAEYLGHAVDACTAEEVVELRAVGVGIKDGDTTWKEALEAKQSEREDATPGTGEHAAAPAKAEGSKIDQLKASLKAKEDAKRAAVQQPAATPADAPAAPAATAAPAPVVTVVSTTAPAPARPVVTMADPTPRNGSPAAPKPADEAEREPGDDDDEPRDPEPPPGALAADKRAPSNEAPKQAMTPVQGTIRMTPRRGT